MICRPHNHFRPSLKGLFSCLIFSDCPETDSRTCPVSSDTLFLIRDTVFFDTHPFPQFIPFYLRQYRTENEVRYCLK